MQQKKTGNLLGPLVHKRDAGTSVGRLRAAIRDLLAGSAILSWLVAGILNRIEDKGAANSICRASQKALLGAYRRPVRQLFSGDENGILNRASTETD